MASVMSDYRVRSTEHRVEYVENEILRDSKVAGACNDLESVIADANSILIDLFELDADMQDDTYSGIQYDAELTGRVAAIFVRWLAVARSLDRSAAEFERQGYTIDGVDALRDGITDVEGGMNPSCEVSDKFIQLRDRAVDDHRQGKSNRVSA